MSFLPTPYTIGVKVYQAGVKDSHGNPVQAWADPVDVPVYSIGPRTSEEPAMPGRDQVIIGLQVLGPPDMTPAPGPLDRVVWLGDEYTIEGEVGDYNHGPFGWQPGCSIALKRVEG